ncbi:MAG: hypothetical protein ACJA1L_000338 [Paracoccaceae bacterium]|jgi:hypothetical protein
MISVARRLALGYDFCIALTTDRLKDGSLMATHIRIRKNDGTDTNPMPQRTVELYLGKMIYANRTASLKQALNDVFSEKGLATGAYLYAGFGGMIPVRHASSGNGQTSVSLFFVSVGGVIYLLAMGEHLNLPSPQVAYRLSDYGQPAGVLKDNARVTLV